MWRAHCPAGARVIRERTKRARHVSNERRMLWHGHLFAHRDRAGVVRVDRLSVRGHLGRSPLSQDGVRRIVPLPDARVHVWDVALHGRQGSQISAGDSVFVGAVGRDRNPADVGRCGDGRVGGVGDCDDRVSRSQDDDRTRAAPGVSNLPSERSK